MKPKWSPKWRYFYDPGGSFFSFFSGLVLSGCQGPPREPKLTILAPKMDPQSSQNGAQESPRDFENATQVTPRVIPTIISKSADVYKQTLNCAGLYLRRSTSKRCCGGVPRSVLNPPQHPLWCCQACKIRCHMSKSKFCDKLGPP